MPEEIAVRNDPLTDLWDLLTGRLLIAQGLNKEELAAKTLCPEIALAMKEKKLRFHGATDTIKLVSISPVMSEIRIAGGPDTPRWAKAVQKFFLEEPNIHVRASDLKQVDEKSFVFVISFDL